MERVIAANGLQGATMSAIAREAGMSKRTLYAVYDRRDTLFETWVNRMRVTILRPLTEEEHALPLRERLMRMLSREAEVTASPRRLTTLRALIAEAPRHPELARAFLRGGPEAVIATVAVELATAVERGELRPCDTTLAARLLCDMVFTSPLSKLLNPDFPEACGPIAPERIDLALDVFIRGLAPPPQGDA